MVTGWHAPSGRGQCVRGQQGTRGQGRAWGSTWGAAGTRGRGVQHTPRLARTATEADPGATEPGAGDGSAAARRPASDRPGGLPVPPRQALTSFPLLSREAIPRDGRGGRRPRGGAQRGNVGPSPRAGRRRAGCGPRTAGTDSPGAARPGLPVTCQGLGVGGFSVSVRVTLQDHWAHMGRPHCCPRTRVRHFSTAAAPRPHGPRGPPACPSSLHLGPQVWRKQNK